MSNRKTGKSVGKRVGGALYLHRTAICYATKEQQNLLQSVSQVSGLDWNVVKFARNSLSLLLYEEFDQSPFPRLLRSVKFEEGQKAGSSIDWSNRKNPPILHRKELLLAPDDRRFTRFAQLTAKAESLGLFKNSKTIGTVKGWQNALDEAGAEIDFERHDIIHLQSTEWKNKNGIQRHKTAIVRSAMSLPFQLMVRQNILKQGNSVLDYGCGQGDDVAALKSAGYETTGWDPHFAPDVERRPAEFVNLGFVLNVIEEQAERSSTLKEAWSYAQTAMSVAVMLVGRADISGARPYKDGVMTSRGTFQKYFTQHEIKSFVQAALGETPLALGPGIFVIFRNKDAEQEFLLTRRFRKSVPAFIPRPPEREAKKRQSLSDKIAVELDELAAITLDLGRFPEKQEVPVPVLAMLSARNVSLQRALTLSLSERLDSATLDLAAASRREDLLLSFALATFTGTKPFSHLPDSVQRDVRAFFGTHAKVQEEARKFLFSLGKPEKVLNDCRQAAAAGWGTYREDDDRFRFLAESLERLPITLRGYVGCAEVLQGNLDGVDVIDLRPLKSTITLSSYDDMSRRLPELRERIRINLARLRVDVRQPQGQYRRYLFWKSRLLPSDSKQLDEQILYEQMLCERGALPEAGTEPTAEEFDAEFADLRA